MANSVDEVIFKLAKSFNQIFDDLKCMYVFGPSADGKIHEDEDIEIVALFDIVDRSKQAQIWPIIGKIETDMDVCLDLYPYTEDDFKQDEDIYNEVMEEGILYNNKGIKE